LAKYKNNTNIIICLTTSDLGEITNMASENRDDDREVQEKVQVKEEDEEKKQPSASVSCPANQDSDLIKILKNPCFVTCSCIVIYGVLLSFIGFALTVYLFGYVGEMEQQDAMMQLHIAQLSVSMLTSMSDSDFANKKNEIRLLLNVLQFARPDCTSFKTRSKTNLECISVSEKLERISNIYQQKYTYTPPLEEPESTSFVDTHQVLSSYDKLLRERLYEKSPSEKLVELSERIMAMHPFPKPYEINRPPVVAQDVRITMNMDEGDECVQETVEINHAKK
jgi:hypothetical protein